MFCGNGGSAADSQHLAAELVGRQNYNRAPAAGIALTVDTSALTAISNAITDMIRFSRNRSKRSAMPVTFLSAFRPRVGR
jgi:phosphoheptose isomerase